LLSHEGTAYVFEDMRLKENIDRSDLPVTKDTILFKGLRTQGYPGMPELVIGPYKVLLIRVFETWFVFRCKNVSTALELCLHVPEANVGGQSQSLKLVTVSN
jgi:dihydroxyacid dehydratase/phosphogluconate dehydratase